MDGAASDLRTGLPWQMVEIHEPVRLVMLVESPPIAWLSTRATSEGEESGRERWLWLVAVLPDGPRFSLYNKEGF